MAQKKFYSEKKSSPPHALLLCEKETRGSFYENFRARNEILSSIYNRFCGYKRPGSNQACCFNNGVTKTGNPTKNIGDFIEGVRVESSNPRQGNSNRADPSVMSSNILMESN